MVMNQTENKCWMAIASISDPEIPVLSIVDLGIVRYINCASETEVEVGISSTYSGCPAMDMIGADIKMVLTKNSFTSIAIKNILTPAWTTEWMSKEGKEKLATYGIAPPDKRFTIPTDGLTCPRCSSENTKLISEFGSTACKALYQCNDCKEPFDYFKCH